MSVTRRLSVFGAIFAMVVLAGSAYAADLPAKEPGQASTPSPRWTGGYIGFNIGSHWSLNDVQLATAKTYVNPAGALSAAAPANAAVNGANWMYGEHRDSLIGGLQIGYDWQINRWLVGLEAAFQALETPGREKSATRTIAITPGFLPGYSSVQTMSVLTRLDYLGTATGRVGLLATPSVLLYGTGGFAFGRIEMSAAISGASVNSPTPFNAYSSGASLTETRNGWILGLGAEWMIAKNWSAKLEYVHYDLGSTSYTFRTTVTAGPGGVPAGTTAYTYRTVVSSHFNGDIVCLGINWRFDAGL